MYLVGVLLEVDRENEGSVVQQLQTAVYQRLVLRTLLNISSSLIFRVPSLNISEHNFNSFDNFSYDRGRSHFTWATF